MSAFQGLVRGVTRMAFGTLPSGETVEAVTLVNAAGMRVRVITYGATLQAVELPDGEGGHVDVALGCASLEGYVEQPQYFGSTCGRFANRIANGRFTLDGAEYRVPVNNGPNSLHGGTEGFDKVVWEIVETGNSPRPFVRLHYVSREGDQGYPGTLTATATYALDEANTLSVEYLAETDRPTIVSLTNHCYWNLAGEGSEEGAMGHILTIPAGSYLPTDETAIPTGEFRAVEGTAFDFRRPTPVGARVRDASDEQIRFGRGYDHNWVIAGFPADSPRLVARVEEPASGRLLEVHSNQPGLQFYSGNFLDSTTAGKSGRLYRQGDAVVLEPQLFPDTPNRPEFGSARLAPGETYRNLIEFRFTRAERG